MYTPSKPNLRQLNAGDIPLLCATVAFDDTSDALQWLLAAADGGLATE